MTASEQALTDLKRELEAALKVVEYALKSSPQEQESALYLIRSDLSRMVITAKFPVGMGR